MSKTLTKKIYNYNKELTVNDIANWRLYFKIEFLFLQILTAHTSTKKWQSSFIIETFTRSFYVFFALFVLPRKLSIVGFLFINFTSLTARTKVFKFPRQFIIPLLSVRLFENFHRIKQKTKRRISFLIFFRSLLVASEQYRYS